jgi:hypothetical protein
VLRKGAARLFVFAFVLVPKPVFLQISVDGFASPIPSNAI